jgi:hypothetical protein
MQVLVRIDTLQDSTIHPVVIDSVIQIPGALNLLERMHLMKDSSWYAGKVAGPALGTGLAITGRVIDHMDTLSLKGIQNVSATSYGETFMIKYSHENTADTLHFPLFWKVYYSRNVGPVLIEEYLDPSMSKTGEMSLQSQAILKSK